MRCSTLLKQQAHEEGIWATTWLPGSSQFLTGSVDETVKLWDSAGDKLESVHTYTGHTLGVVSLAVDSTGQYAASSALDSTIRVWDVKTTDTKGIIETPPTETWAIAFGPSTDGTLRLAAAGGSTGTVKIWLIGEDEPTAEATYELPQGESDKSKKERFVLSVVYSHDYSLVASGAMDGTVAVYDVASGKLLHSLKGHYKPVRSLTFTPDSKFLLTACDDMHCNLYDVQAGALVDSFSGHESWALCVAVHPSGSVFVSGGSDAKVKLWDLTTRTCIQTITEHSDQVWAVAFNPDGSRLVSASDDKQVILYSVA
eukprot:jgi/Chrzof1/5931/Cz16g21010.t1